jgi:hypothetical protein
MTGTEKRLRELARGIGERIRASLPASVGFTLFLSTYGPGGWITYLSSVQRADMIRTIEEMLVKLRAEDVGLANPASHAGAAEAEGPAVQVLVSTNEDERVTKLGDYFRDYLGSWMASIVAGVAFSDRVATELALVFAELAGAAVLSLPRVPDEVIEADAMALARDFVERLRAAAGAPS